MPLNSFFPTRKRILNFTFLLTLCALTAYFIPSRYQLTNLAKPAVLPTVIDNAPTKDKDQPTPTLSAVLGEQNSNQNQSQTDLTQQFIEIKGNLGTLGQLIQKNGKFYLAKNVITNENIQWHTVRDNDLANNSVTSRIIKDHTIQSDDLASNLTMRDLTVNGKLATDKIDLGRNTITDGNLRGNWNLNGGNLTTTGTITANAMNITGATNFTGNATFDGMVTLASLMPKVAGSLNKTVTTQVATPTTGGLADDPQWMAMGQDGFARMVYADNNWKDVHFIQCQDRDCATKTDTIVASNDNGVNSPVVTIASDGFARIAYINYNTPDELHYIACTNADCSTKTDLLVDTPVYYDFYNLAIALDSNNNPYISYDDYTSYYDPLKHTIFKLAHCSAGACTVSTLASTDAGNWIGEQSAIQIGLDGFPRIAYVDGRVTPQELRFIQCYTADCSDKTDTIIDTGKYYYIDMKLGLDGLVRIAYVDRTNTPPDLRFAQCTNAYCTTKNLTTVASPTGLDEVSLALDHNDYARLVYDYTGTLGSYANIGYTMCTNADCSQNSTKPFTNNGYYPPVIAMGQDGLPRIAYESYDRVADKSIALNFARLVESSGGSVVAGTALGSADSPFGSIFGSVINSKELNIQGNSEMPFSIKNSLGSALFSVDSGGNINVSGNITASGNINFTGSINGDLNVTGNIYSSKIVVNPTSGVGWYRISSPGGNGGGSAYIYADIDNTIERIEFNYNIRSFIQSSENLGQITVLRSLNYNSGPISQIRIGADSTDGNYNTYLDIYVSSATTPVEFTVYGTNGASFLATPVYNPSTPVYSKTISLSAAGFKGIFTTDGAVIGGNVGIGTTNPGAKLEINSGLSGVTGIKLTQVTSSSSVGASNGKVLALDANGNIILVNDQVGSGTSLPTGTLAGQTLYYNGSNWVNTVNFFNNGGNVGVGTTNPGAKLEIIDKNNNLPLLLRDNYYSYGFGYAAYGWGGVSLSIGVNSGRAGIGGSTSTFDFLNSGGQPIATINATNIGFGGTSAINNPYFYINNSTGNVGIGTTAPTQKLTVAGNINVVGGSFIDDGTTLNVPDYVFEPGYNLKSIPDLETYINQNLHLPNVPSRDQIKKTGMNYGSMLMTLLEKTEENTLYTIDNYHQITGLTDKNISLDDKLNIISQSLNSLDTKTQSIASLQEQIKNQTKDLAELQKQMTELQTQTKPLIDFYLAMDLKDMVLKDTLGNITLLDGKITAKDIEVLNTIKAKDIEATNNIKAENDIEGRSLKLSTETSGTSLIKAGELESNQILTTEAKRGIKLYITPKGSTQGKTLYYNDTDIEDGVGFKVKIDAPTVEKDIEFNWLIIK